jgi:hypothetical protein
MKMKPLNGRDVKVKNIGGRNYAYDMASYWDKEQKRYRKKSTYLGVITDIETKAYTPKGAKARAVEPPVPELIRAFGDSYSIAKVAENSGFFSALNVFGEDFDTLMSLVCYKILKGAAHHYAEVWARGNFVSELYPEADLASQRISDFLKRIGSESLWRRFFAEYLASVAGDKTSIIIDSTGMPNEIDFPLSAWGNHGGETELETRLLMVVDKATGRPLYFRYMAGNIVDVSTLKVTVEELKELGANAVCALIDAGYFSADNIKTLYAENISFLTRLPAGRKLHKQLIADSGAMESPENLVIYGDRSLFVKKTSVDLFGNPGFAYVVCDVRRKGDETNRFLKAANEDGLTADEIRIGMLEKGKFIMISSDELEVRDVIPMYYTRLAAENIFGISKSNLDLLPLRTHSIETFRGYLMLTFISLIVFLELKSKLNGKFTVEGALLEMGNLMSKSYGSKTIICEATKNMKTIAQLFGYMVPMKLGE